MRLAHAQSLTLNGRLVSLSDINRLRCPVQVEAQPLPPFSWNYCHSVYLTLCLVTISQIIMTMVRPAASYVSDGKIQRQKAYQGRWIDRYG